MKKSLFIAALFGIAVLFSASAREYKNEFVESSVSYKNVTVYKVLDHKDAYIVMYAKGHREVGNIAIPKKWYKEHPSKLKFRVLPNGLQPFMSVYYKDGNFSYVILTMPTSRMAAAWGVADSNAEVNADVDTLDIKY